MGRTIELRADSAAAQVAGIVPRWIMLPRNVVGRQRTVTILPERIAHIRLRRPAWLPFSLAHIPDVLAAPDYLGQRAHGDRRRVEFVRLVGRPSRWLLVSVKFLDEIRKAWVNSAHPIGDAYAFSARRFTASSGVSPLPDTAPAAGGGPGGVGSVIAPQACPERSEGSRAGAGGVQGLGFGLPRSRRLRSVDGSLTGAG